MRKGKARPEWNEAEVVLFSCVGVDGVGGWFFIEKAAGLVRKFKGKLGVFLARSPPPE